MKFKNKNQSALQYPLQMCIEVLYLISPKMVFSENYGLLYCNSIFVMYINPQCYLQMLHNANTSFFFVVLIHLLLYRYPHQSPYMYKPLTSIQVFYCTNIICVDVHLAFVTDTRSQQNQCNSIFVGYIYLQCYRQICYIMQIVLSFLSFQFIFNSVATPLIF